MINLSLVIDGLSKLDDSDKIKLNELLCNAKEEFNNNPTDTILNALKTILQDKHNLIMQKRNMTDPRVIDFLNQKEKSHELFLNDDFMSMLSLHTERFSIMSNSEFIKFLSNLSPQEASDLQNKLNLFYNALYDYALHELCTKKIDMFNEEYHVSWFNISFNSNVYRISVHPNSELGTTCYKVKDLEDEEVILFDDAMSYFIKRKKEEEFQRLPKKEIE